VKVTELEKIFYKLKTFVREALNIRQFKFAARHIPDHQSIPNHQSGAAG
jgi:hypothetical protein